MARVTRHPPTLMSVAYVAHHMREIDRREVFAGRFNAADALAIDVLAVPGFVDVIWLDTTPAAVVGGRELWPGTWSVWAWGTDDWPRVQITLNRHIIRTLIPSIIKRGGWRGQCYSHEDHTEAHAWLKWLGFEHEGTMRQFGRDGSDFLMFAWRARDDVLRRWGRNRQLRTGVSTAAGCAGED